MASTSHAGATRTPSGWATVLWAGAIVGTLDILSAFVLAGLKGATPVRVLQFVASGVLGPASFTGGSKSAALGLFVHFTIAFAAVTAFYVASRRIRLINRHAITSGLIFGAALYAFMNLVALPLSRATPKYSVSGILIQLGIHVFLIGLTIALIVRRGSVAQDDLA